MSTFLSLCQRVRQECGVAGTGPTTVVGQAGMLGKIVDRTARAWVDIQAQRPCWKFLRAQIIFPLTIGVREYNVYSDMALPNVDKWDKNLSYIYKDSTSDEAPLSWYEYPTFRRSFRTYSPGRPTIAVETPGGNIAFDHTPDFAYTTTFDYFMTPEILAANDDVPSMPAQYHDAILWKSVMMFAGDEGASELFVYAKTLYSAIYNALVLDQGELPTYVQNFSLARGDRGQSVPFPRPRT